MKEKLAVMLTPGPTPLPPSVLEALSRPILHHRTAEFGRVFTSVIADLKSVYLTKNNVVVMTCSGSGAMESSVANLLSPGDKILVHTTGAFGDRFAAIARAYGISPTVISEDWGHAADSNKLKEALIKNKGLKAVYLQHTDTSTGIVNNIKDLAHVVRSNSDAIIVVDSISGLAAEELETDAWGLDVVLAASQKGLMNAPGLAFASVSDRAWKAAEAAKLPRFYFNWLTMRESLPNLETPYTPGVNLMVGQAEALRLILQEGLLNVWKRTAALAAYTRAEVARLGLRLYARDYADILTAAWLPEGVDGNALLKEMLREEGISMANGQEKLKGKIIRIAHLGHITRSDLETGIKSLERRLKPVSAR